MPINWAKWGKYVMTSKSQTFSHLASANLSHKVLSHMTTTLSFSSFSRTVCGMHLSSTLRVPSHMVLIQWFFNTVFHYKCSRGATGHIIFWPYTNERPLFKLYFTNTIHISVRLFGFESKMTSKCGRKKKVVHGLQPSATLLFLLHVCVSLNFVSLFMVSISRLGPMIELGTIHIKTF